MISTSRRRKRVKGFVNLICIASPGLTSSPAIAEYVAEEILRDELNLKMELNPDFNPKREGIQHYFHKNWEERAQLIAQNPEYGRIVCPLRDGYRGRNRGRDIARARKPLRSVR